MKTFRFNNLAKTAFQLAFLYCVQFSFSQEWTSYNVANTSKTILNNEVKAIAIDKNGNKWIGTRDGVSRFDGTNWQTFTKKEGLIDNNVRSISVDQANNVWFGTPNGVSKFDGTNWINFTQNDGLINNSINCIYVDLEDNKWFGTSNGVSKFDGTNWTTYIRTDSLSSNFVNCITIDLKGNIWFGTSLGVSKFDGNIWQEYNFYSNWFSSNLSINSISHDSIGNILIGTFEGIRKFDGVSWVSHVEGLILSSNNVLNQTIDKYGNIWFATDSGVTKFDGLESTSYIIPGGLKYYSVNSIAFDQGNEVWFGSYGGVTKFDGDIWENFNANGLVDNYVDDITIDKYDNIWFGTSNGVSKFNGKDWLIFRDSKDKIFGNMINSIKIDELDNIWIETFVDISKFDGNKWVRFSKMAGKEFGEISCIVDNKGNIWMNNECEGVVKFDGVERTYYTKDDGLIKNCIDKIAIDKIGNLWFCSNTGVSKFDGSIWMNYKNDFWSINTIIHSIVVDKNQLIWVGTTDGISIFDGTNWKNYTVIEGLVNNRVNSITIDNNGIVWIGTEGGISKFDGINWINFTTSDGLISNVVECIAIDKQGNKWIGTEGGVSKFADGGAGPLDIFEAPKAIIFNDENENGKKDSTEKGISGQMLQIDSTFSFSQANGFVYSGLTDGSHTISFQAPENWKLTTDSTFTISVPNNGDTLYFGIKAIENRPDLKVNVTSGPTRSNFSANYWVNYKNVGSVTESGTVEVVLDSLVTFESSVPTASSIDGQKLRFDFSDLGVNERKQIRITAKMPNVEFLGDTLTTLVSISPIASDVDSSNNSDTLRSVLTGSYDPNDKAVQQGVLDENYVLFGEKLNYTIRFQNTGNDTAFNVNISDTISSNMDVSSFELIGSSHPCQLEVKGTNTMLFHFYDILLPDSNVNEIGSHGYVQYSIKPKKGLAENTKVNNTGYIYFDYNPAIVTNTTLNTYVSQIPKTISTAGISTISSNNLFSLYPNPTESNFTVDLGKETKKVNVKITDIQGRLVKQESKENTRFVHLNLAENKGIFFVTVSTEKGEETLKVVSRQ